MEPTCAAMLGWVCYFEGLNRKLRSLVRAHFRVRDRCATGNPRAPDLRRGPGSASAPPLRRRSRRLLAAPATQPRCVPGHAWHTGLRLVLPNIFGANETENQQRWWQALTAAHPSAAAELRGLAARLNEDVAGLATAVAVYPLMNVAPKVQYSCLQPLVWTTAFQWFTCVKPKAFSLSVNARSRGIHMESNTSFEELLRRVGSAYLLGTSWGFCLRQQTFKQIWEIAEEAMSAQSYDEALRILSSTPVVSSNYFILAGADGEGSVLVDW
eukprot:Skav234039  [mRNA]  locus=scaffold5814:58540:62240:- [translate_table: standard]